jgi:hypothetical protein
VSADEVKERLAEAQTLGEKLGQLAELVHLGKWKDAARLRDEIQGRPAAHGQIVRLDVPRQRT